MRNAWLLAGLALALTWVAPAQADQDGTYVGTKIEGRGTVQKVAGKDALDGGSLDCASTGAGADCTDPAREAYYGFAPTTVWVTATPAEGAEFVGWTISGSPLYPHHCVDFSSRTCELRLVQGSTQGEYQYVLLARFRDVASEPPPETPPADPPPSPAPVLAFPDADRDGVSATLDCNDGDAAIRPGATDVPGDRLDQDCSGADARAARITSPVSYGWDYQRRWSRANLLTVRDIPAGAAIELSCYGRGCPFKTRSAAVARDSRAIALLPRLKGAKLRVGATLEVEITKPGWEGKHLRFDVRPGKVPKLTSRCIPPGGGAPTRCV